MTTEIKQTRNELERMAEDAIAHFSERNRNAWARYFGELDENSLNELKKDHASRKMTDAYANSKDYLSALNEVQAASGEIDATNEALAREKSARESFVYRAASKWKVAARVINKRLDERINQRTKEAVNATTHLQQAKRKTESLKQKIESQIDYTYDPLVVGRILLEKLDNARVKRIQESITGFVPNLRRVYLDRNDPENTYNDFSFSRDRSIQGVNSLEDGIFIVVANEDYWNSKSGRSGYGYNYSKDELYLIDADNLRLLEKIEPVLKLDYRGRTCGQEYHWERMENGLWEIQATVYFCDEKDIGERREFITRKLDTKKGQIVRRLYSKQWPLNAGGYHTESVEETK